MPESQHPHETPEATQAVPYLLHRDIARRVDELAREIATDYRGRNLLLVAPLPAQRLLEELSAALRLPHERDVLELEPYEPGSRARLKRAPERSLRRRDVLLVDHVVDTGLSLGFLCRELDRAGARTVAACALLDRPHRRLLDDLPLRYVGFVVPDALFGGYGLTHDPALSGASDVYELGTAQEV